MASLLARMSPTISLNPPTKELDGQKWLRYEQHVKQTHIRMKNGEQDWHVCLHNARISVAEDGRIYVDAGTEGNAFALSFALSDEILEIIYYRSRANKLVREARSRTRLRGDGE